MLRVAKDEALARLKAEVEALPQHLSGCSMCGLVEGYPQGTERLGENGAAIAVLDRYATRPGHVLVVLRRHVESLTALGWEEYAEAQKLTWELARALERALSPKRLYVASLGAASNVLMSFPHYHVHVIPLYDGGTGDRPAEVLTWQNGVMMYEEGEAAQISAQIRAAR